MATNPSSLNYVERAPSRRTLMRRKNLPPGQQSAQEAAQSLLWQIDNNSYWQAAENHEQLRDLYRLVDKIRKAAAPTSDSAIRAVMGAIKLNQCETMEEIVEETNLPSALAKSIVEELISEGAATRIDRFPHRPGKFRDYIYKLTGKPFRDWVV